MAAARGDAPGVADAAAALAAPGGMLNVTQQSKRDPSYCKPTVAATFDTVPAADCARRATRRRPPVLVAQ